jgi:hypothetical protein
MSSSSRSIAAARQKRAGEQSQPMNNSRPVTSISSQGAFAQQYQQQQQQQQRMGQNIPIGSKNSRVAQAQLQSANQSANYQTQQSQQNTKISVSNAVGLITLRLGKLEQIINDMNFEEGGMNLNNNGDSIPSNMKLVSDEVFENIVNRINLLESKLLNSKNMESHIEKLEREMKEMKGIVTSSHNALSNFISETNEKFIDIETALALIEENAQINIEGPNEIVETSENIEVNENTVDNVTLEYAETNETNETSENNKTSENSETDETNETNKNNSTK